MEKLYDLFVDTFKSSIYHSITNDVSTNIKEKMLNSIAEIGYKIVSYDKTKVKQVDIDENKYIYFKIDTSLYLRTTEGKVEPLFLDDEKGTHYLMKEGTNSVVIALKISQINDLLGVDYKTPYDIETIFNNTMIKCINMFKNELVFDDKNNYSLVYYDNFINNNESNSFLQVKEGFLELLNKKESKENRLQTIVQEIAKSKSNSDTFLINISNQDFYITDRGENNYNIGYIFEYKLMALVENTPTRVGEGLIKGDLTELSLKYPLEQEDKDDLKSEFLKVFKSEFIGQKEVFNINKGDLQVEKTVVYTNKEKDLSREISGDLDVIETLFNDIVAFCNTGSFVKNKQDLPRYKEFFSMSNLNKNHFTITSNPNDLNNMITVVLGSNGMYVKDLGTQIQKHLDSNNFPVEKFRYIKGDDVKNSLPLDKFSKMLSAYAPKIDWENMLGLYDGRKTVKSSVEKNNKTVSSKETPEVKAIREKYNLPNSVNVIASYEIVGVFHGIPELKGSSDTMILMFGTKGSNPIFVGKHEILENSDDYIKYGFKE